MDKKMFDLNKVADKAEKANRIINRAKDTVIGVIDQNSDGEFNSKDISLIADSIKQSVAEKKKEAELESLRPVFLDDLDRTDFFMSKMICISEIDKKHADSELCANSIGHRAVQGDLDIVYLYKDKLDCFGLSFFPDKESTIYYVDPSDRDNYIALVDYFGYLRIARVNELQKIAQDLGAKHFRVTFKEQKKTAEEKNAKAKEQAYSQLICKQLSLSLTIKENMS